MFPLDESGKIANENANRIVECWNNYDKLVSNLCKVIALAKKGKEFMDRDEFKELEAAIAFKNEITLDC
ncbi:MAG: hypothetical protein AABY22_27535 [Nanoarchaeota archaeon]